MMMFIYGFASALLLCFLFYHFLSYGVKACVKDKELAVAVYKTKSDTWQVTDNFDEIVRRIEYLRQHKPHTVKPLK